MCADDFVLLDETVGKYSIILSWKNGLKSKKLMLSKTYGMTGEINNKPVSVWWSHMKYVVKI